VTAFRVYQPSECGPDGYPRAWHDLGDGKGVKHLVREQAEHRCVRCGHPYECGKSNPEWSRCDRFCVHSGPIRWQRWDDDVWVYEPKRGPREVQDDGIVEAARRVLTVHHLRLGHDHKRDLRWWNLAALCQRCHLQIQGKVQLERVWPHEHSVWFRIYAAGWYAWSYLGEDLTRDETLGRLDELLALERHEGCNCAAA
jgi:hypothetical protein